MKAYEVHQAFAAWDGDDREVAILDVLEVLADGGMPLAGEHRDAARAASSAVASGAGSRRDRRALAKTLGKLSPDEKALADRIQGAKVNGERVTTEELAARLGWDVPRVLRVGRRLQSLGLVAYVEPVKP